MPAAPPAPVHWQQTNLHAIAETDGHGTTCGIDAALAYLTLHNPVRFPESLGEVDALYNDAHDAGLIDTPSVRGMTVDMLASALRRWGVTPVKVSSYNPNLDFQVFRHDLITALLAHQLVIMETSVGQALPDNQPGVFYHFVLIGGIDSTLGYWVANGDSETALRTNGVVPPTWMGVGALAASKPVGYVILPTLDKPAPPPPPAPPTPPPPPAPEPPSLAEALPVVMAAIAGLIEKAEG